MKQLQLVMTSNFRCYSWISFSWNCCSNWNYHSYRHAVSQKEKESSSQTPEDKPTPANRRIQWRFVMFLISRYRLVPAKPYALYWIDYFFHKCLSMFNKVWCIINFYNLHIITLVSLTNQIKANKIWMGSKVSLFEEQSYPKSSCDWCSSFLAAKFIRFLFRYTQLALRVNCRAELTLLFHHLVCIDVFQE